MGWKGGGGHGSSIRKKMACPLLQTLKSRWPVFSARDTVALIALQVMLFQNSLIGSDSSHFCNTTLSFIMYNFCTSLPNHFLLVLKGQQYDLVLCQVHPLCDMKFKIIISPDPHPVRALPRFRSIHQVQQQAQFCMLPVFASYRYWQWRWEVIWKMFPKAQRAFQYHNVFIFLLKRRDELYWKVREEVCWAVRIGSYWPCFFYPYSAVTLLCAIGNLVQLHNSRSCNVCTIKQSFTILCIPKQRTWQNGFVPYLLLLLYS